ncbi:CPBP family intramembrane glutamic endopeptidase [Clostridium peptidivorans]|uniref:CPBP family intramembrane glutamic endopeptidase n=1 Tax=Clostridium peptidivorans TaxID=100174 RepID=UPI000BE27140|nr:CPBP family intramembrane glutamic endopeptidase [Clostridium peptidivorans]
MEEFFESIKIRKLVLVYISVVVFFCIISELNVVKSSKLLDENLLLLLVNLGILLWFILKLKKSSVNVKKEIINLRSTLNSKDIVFSILINITLTIGLFITVIYVVRYISPSLINEILNETNEPDTSTLYSTIVNAIGVSFIGPITEEFMFRGVILNRLKMKMGIKKAVILSSILFGMIHYTLGVVSAVVFGICMSLIYLRTKNIFVTSVIHIINNFIVSVVQVISFVMSKGASQESITMNDFNLYWLIFGILFLIASVVMSGYFIKATLREIRTKNKSLIQILN